MAFPSIVMLAPVPSVWTASRYSPVVGAVSVPVQVACVPCGQGGDPTKFSAGSTWVAPVSVVRPQQAVLPGCGARRCERCVRSLPCPAGPGRLRRRWSPLRTGRLAQGVQRADLAVGDAEDAGAAAAADEQGSGGGADHRERPKVCRLSAAGCCASFLSSTAPCSAMVRAVCASASSGKAAIGRFTTVPPLR